MTSPSEFEELPEDRVLLLSEIIDNTKNNYAISYENSVKLLSLQDWISEQLKLFNKGTK